MKQVKRAKDFTNFAINDKTCDNKENDEVRMTK